jgi:HD-like signal output (HDOD) protein/CheY-like chemotaxis protein
MKRVLFVDDEQQVLDGLRDLLRRQRKQWDMTFATDAQKAMQLMAEKPYDVVVSDMRMPGTDGATLLAHVKQHHPEAARIILSGQADRESVLRALPAAHQFLSKPCDADALRTVIERACQLQQMLSDPAIRTLVGRLDHLPSAPHTYFELTRAAQNPDAGVSDFTVIVEQDPAMSVKVLQLVNSAYFGLAQRVSSVQQAVMRLGVELLKALALSVHAFSALKIPPVKGFSIDSLQQHSISTARLGQAIAGDKIIGAEVFASAVVHDVGKLVLAMCMPEQFAQVLAEQARTQKTFYEVEQELLSLTHAEVGAYLLGYWGLPLQIVETIAFHHMPGEVPQDSIRTLAAVHIADALADERSYLSNVDIGRDQKLDLVFVARAGLTEKLPQFRALAANLR